MSSLLVCRKSVIVPRGNIACPWITRPSKNEGFADVSTEPIRSVLVAVTPQFPEGERRQAASERSNRLLIGCADGHAQVMAAVIFCIERIAEVNDVGLLGRTGASPSTRYRRPARWCVTLSSSDQRTRLHTPIPPTHTFDSQLVAEPRKEARPSIFITLSIPQHSSTERSNIPSS